MQTMYEGKVNSPKALTTAAITAVATSILIDNADYLPEAPNLAVLGQGATAETVLYTIKSDNVLSGVVRGFQGTAQEWPMNTIIARNFTEYDYEALRQNILDSPQGADGKSAYEVAVEAGFVGTETEWLASLVGPQGEPGPQGDPGDPGRSVNWRGPYQQGNLYNTNDAVIGPDGSDYIAIMDGLSLPPPSPGWDLFVEHGKSAYELAVDQGFEGTLEEWLESLKGEPADPAEINAIKGDIEALETALDATTQTANAHAARHAIGGEDELTGYLTAEADPTVPSWAKEPEKPTYTAEEVGAASANDLSAHTDNTDNPHNVTAEQIGAAAPSSFKNLTLSTSWSGSAAPYTQTASIEGITESSIAFIDIQSTTTEAQLAAFESARLVIYAQGANTITFRAWGDKPTIAVPVTVVIAG